MDFKQIEAFVNVVKYRSFSKAADATFFTQPTISTHISNLETELGTQLLDRKGRNVEMTPQGAKFYRYALDMINSRAQAIEALGKSKDNIMGILEIQTSSIPGVAFLPEYLAEFRKEHSEVRYYVSLSDTQSVIDNLMDRRGEIGFIGDVVDSNTFDSVKIASDGVVMIAPKSFDLPSSMQMADTVDLPFIWRETGSATRKTFEKTASKMGYDKESFDVAGLFNDINSIIRSVEAGLGVAIVSGKIAENLEGRVSVIDISDFRDKRDFFMIKLKNASLSPVASAFYNYISENNSTCK